MAKLKTVVVLPAFNAESTLEKTIRDIPPGVVDEIILVDDASRDKTVPLAKKLKLTVHQHLENKGYGGNQKTCYDLALKSGADIVVMLHPDYQYDARLIKYMIEYLRDNVYDLVLGSRIRSRKEALAGGMPVYKYYANRILTFFQNLATGQNLSEWHTGMRAYTRQVLETLAYQSQSDNFIFDTQTLFNCVRHGFRIGEIPVPVRYFPEASSIRIKASIVYGLGTLTETLKYLLRKKP